MAKIYVECLMPYPVAIMSKHHTHQIIVYPHERNRELDDSQLLNLHEVIEKGLIRIVNAPTPARPVETAVEVSRPAVKSESEVGETSSNATEPFPEIVSPTLGAQGYVSHQEAVTYLEVSVNEFNKLIKAGKIVRNRVSGHFEYNSDNLAAVKADIGRK